MWLLRAGLNPQNKKYMKLKKYYKILNFLAIPALVLALLFLSSVSSFAQNLSINLVAVNGSEEDKETPVKYYLPKELNNNKKLKTSSNQEILSAPESTPKNKVL